jgi:ribosomal protein L24E
MSGEYVGSLLNVGCFPPDEAFERECADYHKKWWNADIPRVCIYCGKTVEKDSDGVMFITSNDSPPKYFYHNSCYEADRKEGRDGG